MSENPVLEAPEGNAEDLAGLLGISSRQIRDMARKGLLAKVRRGVYDLRESVKTYYERKMEEVSPLDSGDLFSKNLSLFGSCGSSGHLPPVGAETHRRGDT